MLNGIKIKRISTKQTTLFWTLAISILALATALSRPSARHWMTSNGCQTFGSKHKCNENIAEHWPNCLCWNKWIMMSTNIAHCWAAHICRLAHAHEGGLAWMWVNGVFGGYFRFWLRGKKAKSADMLLLAGKFAYTHAWPEWWPSSYTRANSIWNAELAERHEWKSEHAQKHRALARKKYTEQKSTRNILCPESIH